MVDRKVALFVGLLTAVRRTAYKKSMSQERNSEMHPAWVSATAQIIVFDDALFEDFAGGAIPLPS